MSDEAEPVKPAEAPAPKPSKAMLGLLVLNLAGTGFLAFKQVTAQQALDLLRTKLMG